MKDFFATLYDTWIGLYDSNYFLIYDQLRDSASYTNFGLIFLGIPLVIFLLFYFGFRYPYAKWWHWLIAVAISAVIVWIATRQIAYVSIFETSNNELNDALNNQESGYDAYARPLPFEYAHWNAIMSLAVSFIWSMIIRPFSKIQKHLPF